MQEHKNLETYLLYRKEEIEWYDSINLLTFRIWRKCWL